jgi:hypothetical protein
LLHPRFYCRGRIDKRFSITVLNTITILHTKTIPQLLLCSIVGHLEFNIITFNKKHYINIFQRQPCMH